jgi:subtilisin family serine protease
MGHGTAVAAAIRDFAPNTELIPVRVLDRELATSARILARAIHWAVESRVHIVNLSLGTANQAHVRLFRDALHEARLNRVIVISAAIHAATPWYPGALDGALGVVAVGALARGAFRVTRSNGKSYLETSPLPRPIEGVPPDRNLTGVSFAVANATGLVARALEAGAPSGPADELLRWLEHSAERS